MGTGCRPVLSWDDVGDYVENQGLDAQQTADALNGSFVHCREVDSIIRLRDLWLNLTSNGDPAGNGDGLLTYVAAVWGGALVDYHNALPDTGTKNKALKRRFRQILQNFDLLNWRSAPTDKIQASTGSSEAGFIVEEWTQIAEELADDAGTGIYPYGMTPEEIRAYMDDGIVPDGPNWSGTGGYAYIGVTAAEVQVAIDAEAALRTTNQVQQDDAAARNTYVALPLSQGDRAAVAQGWTDGAAWIAAQPDPTFPPNWGQ